MKTFYTLNAWKAYQGNDCLGFFPTKKIALKAKRLAAKLLGDEYDAFFIDRVSLETDIESWEVALKKEFLPPDA